MAYRVPMDLQKRLVDLGLVPKHCQQVELFIPAVGMLMLRYEVAVTHEHIAQLAAFFADYDAYNKTHDTPSGNPPPPSSDVGGLERKM
jgi:hypothetical protein